MATPKVSARNPLSLLITGSVVGLVVLYHWFRRAGFISIEQPILLYFVVALGIAYFVVIALFWILRIRDDHFFHLNKK